MAMADTAPPAGTAQADAPQVPASDGVASADPTHLTQEDRIGLLRAMLQMRGIEERAMSLYRQGKVPGSFYDGYGRRPSRPAQPSRWPPRTGCASCTATSPPI